MVGLLSLSKVWPKLIVAVLCKIISQHSTHCSVDFVLPACCLRHLSTWPKTPTRILLESVNSCVGIYAVAPVTKTLSAQSVWRLWARILTSLIWRVSLRHLVVWRTPDCCVEKALLLMILSCPANFMQVSSVLKWRLEK